MDISFRSPEPAARPSWQPALDILSAGLAAADPTRALRRHLSREGDRLRLAAVDGAPALDIDLSGYRRVLLVAAGKAGSKMVLAAEEILGDRLTAGVAVVARGTAEGAARTTIHEGGHPLPDPSSLLATRHIARLLSDTDAQDLVIALISGGASALMEMPAGRIPLIDIQSATSALLSSGARIEEMNAVRKHLSAVKGGGLARMASPAPVLSLILSDVVASPLDVIASGPTVPDESTYADAAAVLSRYDLWNRMPASIGDHLRAGMAGDRPETPKSEAELNTLAVRLIGSNRTAAQAARRAAEEMGYAARILTTHLEGEAREAGRFLAAIGKEHADPSGAALDPPICYVVGGETTVTLRRLGGSGGRNQELALGAALALDAPKWDRVTVAAMGTDGIDGPTEAAGALVDGSTVRRAAEAGLDASAALQGHDSASFFQALGDAIVTGPTGTNVNDLALVLVR